jgi:hypothetical protein
MTTCTEIRAITTEGDVDVGHLLDNWEMPWLISTADLNHAVCFSVARNALHRTIEG